MAQIDNLGLPRDLPFDYQLAMEKLAGFAAPRNKLAALCASGEVVRVKKGLYALGGHGRGERVDPLVFAGLIYGPSYVSREKALALHGLIPERVDEITCMATKRGRLFATPVGRFSYRPIPPEVFAVGVGLAETEGGGYFLASAEKALCDRLAMLPNVRAQREIGLILEDDLRIDSERLAELDAHLVAEIAGKYRRNAVRAFAMWLLKQRKGDQAA